MDYKLKIQRHDMLDYFIVFILCCTFVLKKGLGIQVLRNTPEGYCTFLVNYLSALKFPDLFVGNVKVLFL